MYNILDTTTEVIIDGIFLEALIFDALFLIILSVIKNQQITLNILKYRFCCSLHGFKNQDFIDEGNYLEELKKEAFWNISPSNTFSDPKKIISIFCFYAVLTPQFKICIIHFKTTTKQAANHCEYKKGTPHPPIIYLWDIQQIELLE